MSGRLAEGESLDPRAKRCWSKRVRLNYEHPPDNAVASLLLSTLTNLRRHTTGQSIAESPRASPQPLGSDRLEISGANALHFALRGVPKSGSPSFFSQCGRDPSGVSLQGAARQSTSQSARKVSRRLEAFVHFLETGAVPPEVAESATQTWLEQRGTAVIAGQESMSPASREQGRGEWSATRSGATGIRQQQVKGDQEAPDLATRDGIAARHRRLI